MAEATSSKDLRDARIICYVCGMTILLSRRAALIGAAALPLARPAHALQAPSLLRMLTVPTRIYRSTFNERENLDGWVLFLILESPGPQLLSARSLRIFYLSGAETVRQERIAGAALAAITRQDLPPARLTGQPPRPPVFWPQAFRVHCYVPRGAAIDALRFELELARQSVELHVPVTDYQQRAALIFPFRGPGIISQSGVLGGGHRNRSGGFAVDALGLDRNYAPSLRSGSDRPMDYAGWDRPIIAPGTGTIIRATRDRPDQPRDGVSDPAYFAPEYPNGGDVGNHVVIDHGNDEFSLIAHMRTGTVNVRAGDRVVQGQQIGALGNSGDTSGPHIHYQLQGGPDWQYCDGLPVRFSNVSSLGRGTYFDAQ